MSLEAELREQQRQFANHLRNPQEHAAPPGVEGRRLRVYRQLFFNNISQLLASTFPVIRNILDEVAWQALVRDFYSTHRCETPLFPFIAGEFADYLFHERAGADDWPFLGELAQYEWSELALRHADEEEEVSPPVGDKPCVSPLCWPMLFRFPVHRIGAGYLPQEAPTAPTCLLLCRVGDEVRFIESSPGTLRLLQLLQDDGLPDLAAVSGRLAGEMGHPDSVALAQELQGVLADLAVKGVLLS